MNLEQYLANKARAKAEQPKYRQRCLTCRQPDFACYCLLVERFDPKITFAILIHPVEFQRRIATGRLSHLFLQGSHLILGADYSRNDEVNALIADDNNYCVNLFPGPRAKNFSSLNIEEKKSLFPANKRLVIFVIDGTWNTAKKTLWISENLKQLPRVCLTPNRPSHFRVRKQPAAGCFSTVEAIHQTIDSLGLSRGFDTSTRKHDLLLRAFDWLVEQQISMTEKIRQQTGGLVHRHVRKRSTKQNSKQSDIVSATLP